MSMLRVIPKTNNYFPALRLSVVFILSLTQTVFTASGIFLQLLWVSVFSASCNIRTFEYWSVTNHSALSSSRYWMRR